MRHVFRLAAATLVLGAAPLSAQAPAAGDVRTELVAQLLDAEKKLVALAEATPQAKYAWRPAAGVRSTSEVFMHMVGANYMIPPMAGAPKAAGVSLSQDSERSVTDKAAIVDHLKKSFAYARASVMEVPESEFAKPVNLFGSPSTKRGVLVLMATHAHEHLGQSIAYARMNGIVPPWSQGTGGN